jgi:uncharacterized membrane protein
MDEAEFREKVIKTLQNIDVKLGKIESELSGTKKYSKRVVSPETKAPLDVDALLSLPDHLRQTAMVVSAKGNVDAEDVAKETGRTRAAESDYLNQLVKMGYISRKRVGRTVFFHV